MAAMQEPLQQREAVALALFGVELDAGEIVAADRGGHRAAMIGGGDHVLASKTRSCAGNRPRRARSADAGWLGVTSFQPICGTRLPAGGRDRPRRCRGSSQARHAPPSSSPWSPSTACRRRCRETGRHRRPHASLQRLDHARDRAQPARAGAERADAGQDDTVRAAHRVRIGGDRDAIGARRLQRVARPNGDCPRRNRSARLAHAEQIGQCCGARGWR